MRVNSKLDQSVLDLDYQEAEEEFIRLIHMADLDNAVNLNPGLLDNFATGSWTRLTFDHYRSIYTIIVAADELLI